mgnify:CR=1 FL=1
MATKIRLQRHGRKGYAFYSIVIADVRAPRDGKFTEKIGTYNPNTNPATVDLNFERALHWVECGAQPTDTVRNILSDEGVLLMKHLKGGVRKGAFDEAAAQAKFDAWKQEKVAKAAKAADKTAAEKKAAADLALANAKAEAQKALADALKAQGEAEAAAAKAAAAKEYAPFVRKIETSAKIPCIILVFMSVFKDGKFIFCPVIRLYAVPCVFGSLINHFLCRFGVATMYGIHIGGIRRK